MSLEASSCRSCPNYPNSPECASKAERAAPNTKLSRIGPDKAKVKILKVECGFLREVLRARESNGKRQSRRFLADLSARGSVCLPFKICSKDSQRLCKT